MNVSFSLEDSLSIADVCLVINKYLGVNNISIDGKLYKLSEIHADSLIPNKVDTLKEAAESGLYNHMQENNKKFITELSRSRLHLYVIRLLNAVTEDRRFPTWYITDDDGFEFSLLWTTNSGKDEVKLKFDESRPYDVEVTTLSDNKLTVTSMSSVSKSTFDLIKGHLVKQRRYPTSQEIAEKVMKNITSITVKDRIMTLEEVKST